MAAPTSEHQRKAVLNRYRQRLSRSRSSRGASAGRVYYQEPMDLSRWSSLLLALFYLGSVAVLVVVLIQLVRAQERTVVAVVVTGLVFGALIAGLLVLVVLVLTVPSQTQFQVTDQALHLGKWRCYPWDRIGQFTRISRLTNIEGHLRPRTVVCSDCRSPRFPAVSALEIYAKDGIKLDDINLACLTKPECHCNTIEGVIRTDGVPNPIFLRALDEDWGLFSDTIRAVAPHVVIEDLDPPWG